MFNAVPGLNISGPLGEFSLRLFVVGVKCFGLR